MSSVGLDVVSSDVAKALAEDVGSGDVTADIVPVENIAVAEIITRDDATLCGVAWVNEVFKQLDEMVSVDWQVADGDAVNAGQLLCRLSGSARALLSGERSALNFLQTLSATATVTAQYVKAIAGTKTQILDTRKTLPGLRAAQKYAVRCGGGRNHRQGLFDAILIKENHLLA